MGFPWDEEISYVLSVAMLVACQAPAHDGETLSFLLVVSQMRLTFQCRRQVAVLEDVHCALSAVEVPWEQVFLETYSFLLQLQEEEDRLEAASNLERTASLHLAVACPSLVVPGPEVAVSADLDHCTPAYRRCLPPVRWESEMARPVGSTQRVPKTGIWSTEWDRNHHAKRQPAALKICGDKDAPLRVST